MSGIVGTAIPVGTYDSTRAINLGTNRWTFRLGVGTVAPLAKSTARESANTVMLYTDSAAAFGQADTRSQDPLFISENHVTHAFNPKWWRSSPRRCWAPRAATRHRSRPRRHRQRRPPRPRRRSSPRTRWPWAISAASLEVSERTAPAQARQREYASQPRDGKMVGLYAQQLRSDPSRQNGLYWEVGPEERRSPLGDHIGTVAIDMCDAAAKKLVWRGMVD